MGREIRRVPPNWKHPRYSKDIGEYMPMHDQTFDVVAVQWLADCNAWQAGIHEDCAEHKKDYPYWWEWSDSPPEKEYYRPEFTEEPTWYQMYQTVSEGSPVTPPFDTKAELVNWLIEKGECYGTHYEKRYSRAQAEAFVEQEWAPSMVITPETGLVSGVEYAEQIAKEKT